MDEDPQELEAYPKNLSRWQLFLELRRQKLVSSGWLFSVLQALPTLIWVWLAEFFLGPQGLLDAARQQSGPRLIENALELVDAYAEAAHTDDVWGMHMRMAQIYRARVVAFTQIALSAPSGYGQALVIGFLQEFDRRVEWRLRIKGAHPEQLKDQAEESE